MKIRNLLFVLLMSLSTAAAAFEIKLTGLAHKVNDKNLMVLSKDGQNIGFISTMPRADIGLVKVETKDGNLTVDTKDFYSKKGEGKREVVMIIQGVDISEALLQEAGHKDTSKKNTIEVDMSGGKKGLKARLFFEGSTGKHFFLHKKFTLNGNLQTLAFSSLLPHNLERIHIRFDMLSPGKYTFYAARFYASPK